jgi:hypothetical protein
MTSQIKGNCSMFQDLFMIIIRKTPYLILVPISIKHYQDFTISMISGNTRATMEWIMTSMEEKEKDLGHI